MLEFFDADGEKPRSDTPSIAAIHSISKSATQFQLPQHRRQWQLLDRVRWLERTDSGALLPIIGDAAH